MKYHSLIIVNFLIFIGINLHADEYIIDKSKNISNIRNGVKYTQKIYILKKKNQLMQNSINGASSSSNNTNSSSTIKYMYKNGNKFNSKSEIMLKLDSSSEDKISYIEQTYNITMIRKMNSGDYLFKNPNSSDANTLDIMQLLLNDENINIKRVNPNMRLNMHSL